MQFKEIRCLLPKRPRASGGVASTGPCGAYLCDVEANAPVTLRFTCRNPHAQGHSNRIEFKQDSLGNVVYREIKPGNETGEYSDSGVRFPAISEEAQ